MNQVRITMRCALKTGRAAVACRRAARAVRRGVQARCPRRVPRAHGRGRGRGCLPRPAACADPPAGPSGRRGGAAPGTPDRTLHMQTTAITMQAAVDVLQAWLQQLSSAGPPGWSVQVHPAECATVLGVLGRLHDLLWLCGVRVQCSGASTTPSVHAHSKLHDAFERAAAACAAAVARLAALPYGVLDPQALQWHTDIQRVAAEVNA